MLRYQSQRARGLQPRVRQIPMSSFFDTSLDRFNGPARVVVDKVFPSVDDGLFPVKRADGDVVKVRAHVFADGHDTVLAVVQHRRRGEEACEEFPLAELPNDEWEGEFTPRGIGFHEYRIVGWVDHFRFWFAGFGKKQREGQRMDVELQIGADLVDHAANRAPGAEAQRLHEMAAALRDENGDMGERVALAQSAALYGIATRFPDRSRESASQWFPLIVERERAIFGAWYEFFPRSWGPEGRHGTFDDAQRLLPEIQRMGFDIVYLPPIHPIGQKFRKGRNNALNAAPDDVGSPWAIGSAEGGHKAVHPQLGTLETFRNFVWRAGELGLEVALDIAFQCSPDHPWIQEHPDWFTWRPDGSIQYAENPPKKYQDIVPFNFETADWRNLWQELKSVFDFWIAQGVKIFRVDNPHTKAFAFWQWCVTSIKAEHPEVMFLAEAFTRPKRKYWLAKAGYTQGYTYFTWRTGRDELRQYVEELTTAPAAEFFWPNFWPNTPDILHDYIVHGTRNGSIARMVLAGTLSSNWGMYGPAYELIEHEPYPGKEEYNHNEKYELKQWDWDKPGNIKALIARLNRARHENPALQRTRNIHFADTDNPSILAYVKTSPDGDNTIITVVNLDFSREQGGWIDLPWESGIGDHEDYNVRDLLSQDLKGDADQHVWQWHGRRAWVSLRPGFRQAHILRVERV